MPLSYIYHTIIGNYSNGHLPLYQALPSSVISYYSHSAILIGQLLLLTVLQFYPSQVIHIQVVNPGPFVLGISSGSSAG